MNRVIDFMTTTNFGKYEENGRIKFEGTCIIASLIRITNNSRATLAFSVLFNQYNEALHNNELDEDHFCKLDQNDLYSVIDLTYNRFNRMWRALVKKGIIDSKEKDGVLYFRLTDIMFDAMEIQKRQYEKDLREMQEQQQG